VFIATDDNSFDDGGALFESADGGATWAQRDVPFDLYSPLNGLFFLDSQHGWTYGNANYRTTDGGENWTELPALGSTYFMEFYTPDFGLASGNFVRFVSHDGGLSWVDSPNGTFAFDFIDTQLGLGVSTGGIYRTTDGGANFSLVKTGDAASAIFLSSTVAVAIIDGAFVRSTNGGVTWTTGPSAAARKGLIAVSPSAALAWAQSGSFTGADERVLRTSDSGQTWSDLGEVLPVGVFEFVVPTSGLVIGADFDGNMFRSSDAGANWVETFASPGPRPNFLSSARPAFADAQTG